MARIRSVKPSLRTSETVASWPREVRYFWVLLWGYLDDLGRGLDIPKLIAGDCFPLDDDITAAKVNRWLDLISTKKDFRDAPLCRYEVGGRRYIHSLNWSEHQRPNRPSPSPHPPCPVHDELSVDEAEEAAEIERRLSALDGDSDREVDSEEVTKPNSAGKVDIGEVTRPNRDQKTPRGRHRQRPPNSRSP